MNPSSSTIHTLSEKIQADNIGENTYVTHIQATKREFTMVSITNRNNLCLKSQTMVVLQAQLGISYTKKAFHKDQS